MEKQNQSNLCFLDHYGTLMSCSATVLLEAGELVSLKVTNENYFGGKKCQNFTFLTQALRSRMGGQRGGVTPPPPPPCKVG